MKRNGFVLIPQRGILLEAIALSRAIPENSLELDLEWHIPHVTLLQTQFASDFKPRDVLEKARGHRGFNGEPASRLNGLVELSTPNHERIVWWSVVNAKWLGELNHELVEMTEDFIIKPTTPASPNFSPQEKEAHERTGYFRNLDAYDPHITVGVGGGGGIIPTSPKTGSRVAFHRIAYVEHGNLGEITKIIDSLDLPSSWD